MIHHSNKQIEQNDDVDERERSEEEESKESSEVLDSSQLKIVEIDEPEDGPVKCLSCFPKAARRKKINIAGWAKMTDIAHIAHFHVIFHYFSSGANKMFDLLVKILHTKFGFRLYRTLQFSRA